jgi:8-oxo-dGTP pyrophosphatase MutT (NUDIX family)
MVGETTKRENYCGNCGEEGHTYRRCLAPIISLGVILYKENNNNIEYLMVQRRDTLGFVEFMRGKYNLENSKYIFELFKIMTEAERVKILNNEFDFLWQNLWMNKNLKKFQNEYNNSKKKFNILKRGTEIDGKELSLLFIHKSTPIVYKSPEWGFPKGRRNNRESDLDCAKREFEEESGYESNKYEIVPDIEPVIELFSGTNNIRYKHIYYLGKSLEEISLDIDKENFNQVSEISKIKWFNYKDAYEIIRDYNIEKKEVLKKTNDLLTKKIFVNSNDDK